MATNRVAVVTGGTRGIGEAIARRLAGDGFSVFISGSTEQSTQAAVARYQKEGLSIRGFAAFPEIDTATDPILAVEIVFSDQPRGAFVVGRGLLEHGLRRVKARALRKLEPDDGCNHGGLLLLNRASDSWPAK